MRGSRLAVLSLLLCVLLLMTASPAGAAASGFRDVKTSHWAYANIRWAMENRIVSGYADGTFRPDNRVTEAEFLVMLLRAYPKTAEVAVQAGAPWYAPYFAAAERLHWPILHDTTGAGFDRGETARLLSATQGELLDRNAAVRYLLDHHLAAGKTDSTLEGFDMNDHLTRAEAVTLIRNLINQGVNLQAAPQPRREFSLLGVSLGDSVQSVVQSLGAPNRQDVSEYGFTWYIYNADYARYAQIGIQNGAVVALFSNADLWHTRSGAELGTSYDDVVKLYGSPLTSIVKGNTRFLLEDSPEEEDVVLADGGYATFFFDKFDQNRLTAIQVIDERTELSKTSFYGTTAEGLDSAFAHEVFDLANAERVRRGLKAFAWDDTAAGTAQKHSEDMAKRDFFDHENPDGLSPFDRMKRDGIDYRFAAENIAAGQLNAIYAHEQWMNSEGHRKDLLSIATRLGTGVYLGGTYHTYYTEDFYTPQ